jgi:hypothetical protein
MKSGVVALPWLRLPQTNADKQALWLADNRKAVSLINKAKRSEYYAFGAAGQTKGLRARK